MKDIKNINNISIIAADKGDKVIIMNKDKYIQKIEEKLNDTNIYEKVEDPITQIKKHIAEITDKLLKQNKITRQKKMEPNAIEDLPKIRGQPKIHKQGNPMRLITCTNNTILSPLSKYVYIIIKDLRNTSGNCVINTTQFINIIFKIQINEDEKLASLDTQEVFTNIPITRAIDIVINRIEQSKT